MTIPSLIDPNAIALLKSLNDAALPHSAAIQSRTLHVGNGGTHTSTWATDRTVACRLTPAGASEKDVLEARQSMAQWVVVLPAGTAIATTQRIVVTGTDAAGTAFSITVQPVAIMAPGAEALRKVLARDFKE